VKVNIKWIIVCVVIVVVMLWARSTYFTMEARDSRALEKKNQVLRLLAEQQELKYKILVLEGRLMKARPVEDPNE